MNYYIAKTDTLEKVIDLNVNSMSTINYIKLTNKYFQLITGEYILLSSSNDNSNTHYTSVNISDIDTSSSNNAYWRIHCDYDDEYGDETTGWSEPLRSHYDDEDDEYGDADNRGFGWGY